MEILKRINVYKEMVEKLISESTPSTKEWYDKRIATLEGKIYELTWVLFNETVINEDSVKDFLSSPVFEKNADGELIYVSENGKHSLDLTKLFRSFQDYNTAINEAIKSNK